jgi:hypothetical protein
LGCIEEKKQKRINLRIFTIIIIIFFQKVPCLLLVHLALKLLDFRLQLLPLEARVTEVGGEVASLPAD